MFGITNYCNGDEHLNIRRKSYIFVHKELWELKECINGGSCLIKSDEIVKLLVENNEMIDVEFGKIRNW